MNTKELIETLKLSSIFEVARGHIEQGNLISEAAERLEELQETITAGDITDEMKEQFLKTPYDAARKDVFIAAVNSWINHKKQA